MPELAIRVAPILDLPRSAEIVVEGGVNASNAALLKEKIEAAIDRRTSWVSVLMSNVSYINSSGFGYLMDLAMMLERRGGSICLVEVQPKVKVIFNNLGMQKYFRFEPSGETARAYLRSQAEKVAHSPRVIPLDGPEEGVEFPIIGSALKIGSDAKSTIVIKHSQVELRHAEIYRAGEQCFVRDLGTRHGTWVGLRKVNDESLASGDVVKIGSTRLVYYPAGAAPKK